MLLDDKAVLKHLTNEELWDIVEQKLIKIAELSDKLNKEKQKSEKLENRIIDFNNKLRRMILKSEKLFLGI